jgi:hypothetical protein
MTEQMMLRWSSVPADLLSLARFVVVYLSPIQPLQHDI